MQAGVPGVRIESPQSDTGTRAASQTCPRGFPGTFPIPGHGEQGREGRSDKFLLRGEKGGSDFCKGLTEI